MYGVSGDLDTILTGEGAVWLAVTGVGPSYPGDIYT